MRKIGDALINAIGYGAMGISVAYGPPLPTEQRLKVYRDFMRSWAICSYVELQVLDAVYERGCNHWDTSDVYADSEDLIGEWSVLVCFQTTVSDSLNKRAQVQDEGEAQRCLSCHQVWYQDIWC